MKVFRSKIFLLIFLITVLLFLSNDFKLINVEKTAIITAIAIDKSNEDYLATVQVAVPEATDTNTENQKAVISGKGKTVGEALKDIENATGWYPKLAFCNLIILGNNFKSENVIKVLDYFVKTLRVQDSAVVVFSEEKAYTLLEKATPMDNISSFAIQKIILKDPGFDKNIATVNIKDFAVNYYGRNSSSYMPYISVKLAKEDDEKTSSGETSGNKTTSSNSESTSGNSTNNKGETIFDATKTALFKNGVLVGILEKEQTLAFNLITADAVETAISVGIENNGETTNYMLRILRNSRSIKIKKDNGKLKLYVNLNVYCKISDTDDKTYNGSYSDYTVLPKKVKEQAEINLKKDIEKLLNVSSNTECDVLKLDDRIYKYHNSFYSNYKENPAKLLDYEITVTVNSQK